jgi:hypothetical protein
MLFHAMYGGGHWAHPGDPRPTIEAWPIPTSGGRDGAMTAKHAFISAVVALHERRDPSASVDAAPEPSAEGVPYVHVMDALSSGAVPVPSTAFDATSDARWSPDADVRYRQVRGTLRRGGVADHR